MPLSVDTRRKAALLVERACNVVRSIVKNCGTGAGGFQPGNDCARGGGAAVAEKPTADGARILFEVAPDPNDAKLTARWNSLSENDKVAVSHTVAGEVLPKVFDTIGVKAELVDQFGGYMDSTNPSFAAVVDSNTPAEDLMEAAKMSGFVLSQDSMMVVGSRPFEGADEVGLITVKLPANMNMEKVHGVYSKLREIDGGVVQGHTTVKGEMLIVNFAGDTPGLQQKIYDKLGGEYDVLRRQGYAAFPQKQDYGYDNGQGQNGRGSSELDGRRSDADRFRTEASRLIDGELRKRGKSAGGEAEAEDWREVRKARLIAILDKALAAFEKNCGTGAGGFQPGNTCAGGGGDGKTDAPKPPAGPSPAQQAMRKIASEFKGKPAHPDGVDSMSMYRHSDGTWTPERQALHEAVIAKVMEGVTPADTPVSYLMGGGPASGKSTAIRAGLITLDDNRVKIAADEIMESLPEFNAKKEAGDIKAAGFAYQEATYIAAQVTKRATAGGYNLSVDGTGDSGVNQLAEKVAAMRANGAKVVAHYMTINPDEAVRRDDVRSKTPGPDFGRKVGEAAVRASHAAVSRVVPLAVANGLYDEFDLHDTEFSPPKLVASATGKDLKIHDQALWDKFLAKGHTVETKAKVDEALTVDQIAALMMAEMNGLPQPIRGAAADKFLIEFRRDISQAEKDGVSISVPNEWPSLE